MVFTDFKTGKDDTGRRLDKVIRIFIPSATLPNIYKSLRKGLIKVNGAKSSPDYRICEGDVIQIADFIVKDAASDGDTTANVRAPAQMLDKSWIIFENEHILILNKPAGINVHSAKKGEISLQELVTAYYNATRTNDSLSFKPGPLHRIDKYTQGLVCFSMSTAGAQWFSSNMKSHNIKKTYEAIVQGKVEKEEIWKDKIEKLEETGQSFHTMQIKADESGLECITKITPLGVFSSEGHTLTRVLFDIETGRQHQIRSQSAFHGHPLFGDTAYGGVKTVGNKGLFYLQAKQIIFPKNELKIPEKITLED